ncbi:MAG: serine/threonine-protein kinase [Myxococcaceae bacterium]
MAEAGAATDPLLGRVLNGRFTILEPLGVGGMGKVYKALQAPLDRVVALKVLNPGYAMNKDPGFQRRFFLEASLTAKLHHPNTITVHDYGRTDDGIFFIAMEYVEGVTLAQVLVKEGPMAAGRALHVAQQICRSLREAHKLGVVHRDLKPANVMIINEDTERDQVKVLDFGLVKSFLPEDRPAPDETELTQAGVLLGSPMYMAPEQAKNQSDPRSDVYSLGVVLFQMIAGRAPFVGKESIEVIVKHLREKPPALSSLAPGVPPEVEAVVMRCLEKDPEHRYQSMDALLEAMREAALAAGLSGAFSSARSQVMSDARVPLSPSREVPAEVTRSEGSAPLSSGTIALPFSRRFKLLAGISAAALLLIGGLAVAILTRVREVPAPEPVAVPGPKLPLPVPVKPPQVPPPAPVRFQVTSLPPGARVSFAGRDLGPTPLSFEVPSGSDGRAVAELTFTLEGYQPATLTVGGAGPVVPFEGRLEKKRPAGKARPPRPSVPLGYKEDPYQ